MQASAVRIRRRCDTRTKFDYNRSHLTPSRGLPLPWRRRGASRPSGGVAVPWQRPRRGAGPAGSSRSDNGATAGRNGLLCGRHGGRLIVLYGRASPPSRWLHAASSCNEMQATVRA
jgi:hypothetical protein